MERMQKQVSLSFIDAVSRLNQCATIEPFQVDIEAVKVRFSNGESVVVTQSFTDSIKFDLWVSERDPYRPAQILPELNSSEATAWLEAISYRILQTPPTI